mmetsp:Transcript_22328/g.72432  ORF Transcript_22328/g.72432 Transcript_22328/m.72432 type:complete len:917 (+) Transcript_22328:117-2867(+)
MGCCVSQPAGEEALKSTELSAPEDIVIDEDVREVSGVEKAKELGIVARRLAVCTPPAVSTSLEVGDFEKKVVPKSAEIKSWLMETLREHYFFSIQDEAVLNDVADAMEEKTFTPGARLIRQGDDGDNFYVVFSGSLSLKVRKEEIVKNRRGSTQLPVSGGDEGQVDAVLEKGSLFGELALLYNAPRAASVSATTECVTYVLDRDTFRALLMANSQGSHLLMFLRQVPVIDIKNVGLVEVAKCAKTKTVKSGETVIASGSVVERWHIVRKGRIEIKKDGKAVQTLKETNFFGQSELLADETSLSDYVAETDAELIYFDKADFISLLPNLKVGLDDWLKFSTMQRIPMLESVDNEQLSLVVDAFKEETYKKDETIIKQGDVGDTFFILKTGRASVTVDSKPVAVLKCTDYFGERALLTRDRRAADVTVTSEEVTVLKLERMEFNILLGPLAGKIETQSRIKLLETVPILESLSILERETLAKVLKYNKFEPGAIVMKEKDTGDSFFIIKDGEVTVTKASQKAEVARLGKGAFFGEQALLKDDVRSATITAVSLVEAYSVTRGAFEKHLSSLSSMMEEHQRKQRRAQVEKDITWDSLKVLDVLGTGQFGVVSLVSKGNETYALKAIRKKTVQEFNIREHIKREAQVLEVMDHPFVLRMVRTFGGPHNVYMLLEFVQGGELFNYLCSNRGRLKEDHCKFVAACVLSGLLYMHGKGIMYRDLKTENLMIDNTGYIKIVDMGFAKHFTNNRYRTFTMCGTPEYMAPEIITGKGHNYLVDYWALGVLIYEMSVGHTPFVDNPDWPDQKAIFKRITRINYTSNPGGVMSSRTADLCKQLFQSEDKRLGSGKAGGSQIRKHPWFTDFPWIQLERRNYPNVPFPVSKKKDPFDISAFPKVEDNIVVDRKNAPPVKDHVLDAIFGSW